MKKTTWNGLNRRDFNRLTAAAFGGVVAGTTIGCGGGQGPGDADTGDTGETDGDGDHEQHGEADGEETADVNPALLLEEPHVCRGLNACQEMGRSQENACAGQSACYTAEMHSCSGMNACKGQGGCGDTIGMNTCQTKGACAVPLMDRETWDKARNALKEQLAEQKPEAMLGMPPEMGPPKG